MAGVGHSLDDNAPLVDGGHLHIVWLNSSALQQLVHLAMVVKVFVGLVAPQCHPWP